MTAQFHAQITPQGDIRWHHERSLRNWLAAQSGRHFRVSFSEPKRPRSANQNAFYWGVVVPAIANETGEFGKEGLERVHEALKMRYLPSDVRGLLELPGSTAKLSTKEFEQYVENIRVDAASGELLGSPLIIPLPNEDSNGSL